MYRVSRAVAKISTTVRSVPSAAAVTIRTSTIPIDTAVPKNILTRSFTQTTFTRAAATIHSSIVTNTISPVATRFSSHSIVATASPTSAHSNPSSYIHLGRALLAAFGISAASMMIFLEHAASEGNVASSSGSDSSPSVGRSLYSFGSNQFGCLGVGDETSRSIPTLISTLDGVEIRQIVAASNVAGLLTTDGTVFTWGQGSYLALGHGDKGLVAQPKVVEGLVGKKITHLSLSETHGAAIESLDNGETKLWVWGNRALGFLPPPPPPLSKGGRGSIAVPGKNSPPNYFASAVPIELTSLAQERIVQVAVGKHHSLALTADGRVFSFGSDRHGALALGEDALTAHEPKLISSLQGQKIVSIAAGNGSSLFLTERGDVYAAGSNESGQCGTGSNARRYASPTHIKTLHNIRSISAGAYHNFAIDTQGRAFGFGWNQSGQIGIGHRNLEVRQPSLLTTLRSPISSASAGFETTALVSQDERLFMQGRGREGQLGRGDQVESIAAIRDSPVEVTFFSSNKLSVAQAAAGADFTLTLVKESIDQATGAAQVAAATPAPRARR